MAAAPRRQYETTRSGSCSSSRSSSACCTAMRTEPTTELYYTTDVVPIRVVVSYFSRREWDGFDGPVLSLLSHCSSQEPLCNPHQSLDDIVNEISSLISPNQAAANCSSTSSSAESSTTTQSPRVSIHVVMQVTKEIATYGRRTAAANAIWARSHSHTMSVHGPLGGSRPAPRGYDARFGKVQFLRKSAEGAQEDAQNEHKWLLWLDADAFVAVHHDWAKEVILRFGSAAHVIASLIPARTEP